MPDKRHDRNPAEILAQEHQHFLAFLRKRVRTDEEAKEILQAAYAKGLCHLKTIDKSESVVAWFFQILRNSLVDYWRRRAMESNALEQFAQENKDKFSEIETDLEDAVCSCINKLIEIVKPEYAEILQKVDLGDMPLQDFARQSGVSPNNATVRIHRARQSLKKRLVETCGACATEQACLDCNCKQRV